LLAPRFALIILVALGCYGHGAHGQAVVPLSVIVNRLDFGVYQSGEQVSTMTPAVNHIAINSLTEPMFRLHFKVSEKCLDV